MLLRPWLFLSPIVAILAAFSIAIAGENLIDNGGFESDAATARGWSALWTRDANAGRAELDEAEKHGGQRALKIMHTGANDWSFEQQQHVPAGGGDILSFSAWIKREGGGEAGVSVVTRNEGGDVLDWSFGAARATAAAGWQQVRRKFVIPAGCFTVQARFVGSGAVTAWLDNVELVKEGNVSDLERAYRSKRITLENPVLRVTFAESGSFNVEDKRNHRTWTQRAFERGIVAKDAAAEDARHAKLDLFDIQNDLSIAADFQLDAESPELRVTLSANGALANEIAYPHPMAHEGTQWLVVPLNEGILYPVSDASISPMSLIAYGGHGISMPWMGAYEPADGAGMMSILETPDDAAMDLTRHGGSELMFRPIWEASRGSFSYPRIIRYVFFERGGYVAQAARYREFAKQTGLLKTLQQKKAENSNVDLLVGAANVWNWDMNKLDLCKELKAAGVERVLFSASEDAKAIPEIEKLGVLAGRYDIYQDVFPPDAPQGLNHEGWPDDLVRLSNGAWMRGWTHQETKADGTIAAYEGGVICSLCQLKRARQKIPEDLQTHPYTARFIDTTTATPWRECYNPRHPLTRSDDRKMKMALLEFVSKNCQQVTGSETGIDPSVPFVHYYEGMLSLGPYRLPDSGRNMMQKQSATPGLITFQTGHTYRVPLWELVYHDCVCAQWYWGDYNNKVPEVWARRDLINILYATSPMYMFDQREWEQDKKRIVDSAATVCRAARRFGYEAMLSHSFLTSDHAVQMTEWGGGGAIIVNFGEKSYMGADRVEVKPMNFWIKQK